MLAKQSNPNRFSLAAWSATLRVASADRELAGTELGKCACGDNVITVAKTPCTERCGIEAQDLGRDLLVKLRKQFLEPRISAQRIEFWVVFHKQRHWFPLFQTFGEILDGLVSVA